MQNEHTDHEAEPHSSRAEYWAEQIQNWKDSGLSKAEYCQQNQLTKHAFHYWCKKLERIPEQEQANSIVPLDLQVQSSRQNPPLVLKISHRFQVAIQGDFHPPVLQKLIKTLEEMS